jgi:hypothetical protein
MSFTQTDRVWWDTAKPGSGTSKLEDAKTPTTPTADEDSGTTGRHGGKLWKCARSGFTVPFIETVLDVVKGVRVWFRFADKPAPTSEMRPETPPTESDPWVI